MGKLVGKRAVITGATGGIGEATARRFLAEGASVVLASRSTEKLEELAQRLASDRVFVCPTDVAVEDQCKSLAEFAQKQLGGLDIVFANAGFEGSIKPLTDIEQDEFDAVQNTNVRGTWLTIKHMAPLMLSGGGSIIVSSSVSGKVGVSGLAAYAASKHAVIGLAEVAALEFATSGIRVNALAPSPVDNAMMRSIEEQVAPGAASAAQEGFEALIPMGRYAKNEEVAAMACFLASDDAVFCTGSVYRVDGGFLTQ